MTKFNSGGPAHGQSSSPPPPHAPAAPADDTVAFSPAHGADVTETNDAQKQRMETAMRAVADGGPSLPPPANTDHGSPDTAPPTASAAAAPPPQAARAGRHSATDGASRKTPRLESSVPRARCITNPKKVQTSSPPPPALPVHPAPECVMFHKDPDRDGVDFKAALEGITNPQTISWVHAAFRTVAFVSFPLFTIAIHPNTMYRLGFPQMLIASVVSTSTHRPTLGEQIGLHTWIWRGIIYMLVFGTAVDVWQVQAHIGAWYGLMAAGIFLAGLVSHGMMRRFMYLYFFIFMMEIRMYDHYFGTLPINNAAWSAADFFIGSLLGIAALCFPYPLLVKNLVDRIMSKIFEGLGKMFFAMIGFAGSPDAHAACLFFDDRSPFMKIEAILEVMPPLLWFSNWEPLEFPLHNPIRRMKLSLLRRVMALTYAAFSCGRTVALLHKQQADRIAMHKIRCSLFQAAHGTELKAIEGCSPVSSSHDKAATTSHTGGDDVSAEVRTAKESIAELRKNTAGCLKEFGVVLMQCTVLVGTELNTPELLVRKVPFAALREKDTVMRRSLRMETLEVMRIQSELVSHRRAAKQAAAAQQQQQQQHQGHSREEEEPDIAVEDDQDNRHAPFGRSQPYHVGRADARLILEHHDIIDDAEVFIRMNEIFFQLLLSMIAGELVSFGEQMKDYKPPMSLGRRLLRYFIIEPWNDFWEELWCRVSFARPCDYRTVKDAIRMTCAYLAATALNIEIYVTPGGLYFFGVTILLGLPVEEESLNMCVNRMAGNSLGCALGFLAYHNGNNLAQKIAMTLCFTFVQQCLKNNPLYGQTFLYGSVITMAGLVTSMATLELLTRMIASCYTIVAYMLCCMLIFPNDSNKICSSYRCKLAKVMSEVVDDVAVTLRLPVQHRDTAPTDAEEDRNEPVAYPARNTEAMQLCSQLNVQMSLADVLLSMCDKWAPFAAREPVVRGAAAFPAGPSTLIGHAHKRMVANLRLLVFGVQLLHRPRSHPLSPGTSRILAGSVADFVDEFAACIRLLCQDHIDSIQLSRKWSYPLSLSRTSQISRLHVRLQAINYEYYVVMADNMSRGTFGMTQADFQVLRLEAAQREAAEQVRVQAVDDGEEAGEDELPCNMSFADRYLRARRAVDTLLNGDATGATTLNGQATAEDLRNSIYLTEQQGSASRHSVNGLTQSFVYRAPLHESAVAPNDAFPLTQHSAEREVQQLLREEKAREADAQGHAGPTSTTTETHKKDSEETSHQPNYEPAVPAKSKSHASKLVLFSGKGSDTFVPLYRGPAFTFVEDELATEKDTDFAAVMTILCSCDSLITELQGLTGPVNGVSSYEKQLHESSIITAQLDKWSAWYQGYKKDIYDRYHDQPSPPQSRGSLHAQSDPWKDWRF